MSRRCLLLAQCWKWSGVARGDLTKQMYSFYSYSTLLSFASYFLCYFLCLLRRVDTSFGDREVSQACRNAIERGAVSGGVFGGAHSERLLLAFTFKTPVPPLRHWSNVPRSAAKVNPCFVLVKMLVDSRHLKVPPLVKKATDLRGVREVNWKFCHFLPGTILPPAEMLHDDILCALWTHNKQLSGKCLHQFCNVANLHSPAFSNHAWSLSILHKSEPEWKICFPWSFLISSLLKKN